MFVLALEAIGKYLLRSLVSSKITDLQTCDFNKIELLPLYFSKILNTNVQLNSLWDRSFEEHCQ